MMLIKKIIPLLFLFIGCSQFEIMNPIETIIPRPLEIIEKEGSFTLNSNTEIISTSQTLEEADYLSTILENIFGKAPSVKSIGKAGIILSLNPNIKTKTGGEGYIFTSSQASILIEAATTSGIFYGIQTLRQLLPHDLEKIGKKSIKIKAVSIIDKPRFPWRAFMLDEARYFKGTKVVKMLLDQMALHKMNTFHWHLVDDQGWRIEIKKYPRLIEIGSKRKDSMIGGWNSDKYSGKPHEGFYTQEEIKDIVLFAKKRHITIVPEIEMPGHSASAIVSYSWLGTSGEVKEVPSRFGGDFDIYNVTDPNVEHFIKDVLTEVMDLFPSQVIHIGGDEVDYTIWKNSKSISDFMKKNKVKSPADLQISFTNKISEFINAHDRRMMGWNDILGGVRIHDYQNIEDIQTSVELAPNSIIHFWKGDISLVSNAVERGYDIVNSLHTMTYLDYDYKKLSIEKAYSFDPIPEELNPKYHRKVLGLGCQMWGEWIPTEERMEYQVFPRLSAYAEIGWSDKSLKNFEDFMRRLSFMKDRWNFLGIKYAEVENK